MDEGRRIGLREVRMDSVGERIEMGEKMRVKNVANFALNIFEVIGEVNRDFVSNIKNLTNIKIG